MQPNQLDESECIEISDGEVLLGKEGVTLRMRGQLWALSRSYSWRHVPKGMAVLRALHDGGSAFERVLAGLKKRGIALDVLYGDKHSTERRIEDVERVVSCVHHVVDQCPYDDIAHEIKKVSLMSDEQLSSYVSSFL